MAARKTAAKPAEVNVIIDEDYLKSWDGVLKAAQLRSLQGDEEAADADKLLCVTEYYARAVKNIDEVVDSLGGGSAPFERVIAAVNAAMESANSKK